MYFTLHVFNEKTSVIWPVYAGHIWPMSFCINIRLVTLDQEFKLLEIADSFLCLNQFLWSQTLIYIQSSESLSTWDVVLDGREFLGLPYMATLSMENDRVVLMLRHSISTWLNL